MKKIAQKILLPIVILSTLESAFALDSDAQNLTSKVGATDYFKISCASDATDHLNFKLFEGEVKVENTPPVIETLATPPQVLNATLTKLKLTASASEIVAGTNKEITLKGGNGLYRLTLDTFGTNLTLRNQQTYSVQYQCLNSAGKMTAGSSILAKSGVASRNRRLANKRTAKFSIRCKKDKIAGNTSSLKVKLFNKTVVPKTVTATALAISPVVPDELESSGHLMAQVIKGSVAQNTIGDILDIQGGNGNYDVMVNSPTNKALPYHFEYSCLDAKNIEVKTAPFQVIQDQ